MEKNYDFFSDDVLNYKPTLKVKLKVIFSDVKTKGEMRGNETAAREYSGSYERLEKMFRQIIDDTGLDKKAVYEQVEHVKKHFKDLFKYKEALEKQVAALVANVSGRLKIPVDRILQMVNSNTLLISDNNECLFDIVKSDSELMLVNIMGKDNPNDPQSQNESRFTKQNFRPNFKKFHSISLIDILYRHKLSVFYNAKRERYIKSVMEYETKIKNLKTSALKKVQNNIVGCEKMRNIIQSYINDITKLEIEIAGLRTILSMEGAFCDECN